MYRATRPPSFARLRLRLALLSTVACCLALAAAWAYTPALAEKEGAPATAAAAPETPAASAAYGRLPLGFEPNRGQADARAQFVVRGAGFDLLLARGEAVIRTHGAAEALRMRVVGANPRARAEGLDPLAGVSNYLVGRDPSRWLTGVPRFARVRYAEVYPGVDLDFYGNPQQLEYDFRVAPFADPSRIALDFRGARSVKIVEDGDILLTTREGADVRLLRPVAYQQSEGGGRREVEARYQLKGGRVRFRLGAYDRALPLVIDPVVAYASFLGGSGDDRGLGVAADAQGSAYVAGLTTSLNFPLRGALKGAATGASDAFVAKLSPNGSSLVYATYFGGSANEQARAVAVDSQGSAYITGITDSTDLPAVNAFQPSRGSTANFLDAFVAKLSPAGNALVYSTYLGGWRPDEGDAIAVDAAGSAYVVGATGSFNTGNATLRTFPVTAGAFQTDFPGNAPDGGNTAAFVSKLSPAGNTLEYSTFLGGLGNDAASGPTDIAFGVAVDAQGSAYVTGRTESHRFPVASAAQPTYGGGAADAFLTKLDPAGTSLVYSTFLGGAGEEDRSVGAVAVDAQGNAYATGGTDSTDFPVINALQPAYGGNPETEAFLTKLDAGGAYVFSTYLGANNFKRAFGVAVDAGGNVYLAGTNSLRKVSASGAGVEYAVTLGGEGRGVALDPAGNAYVAGVTTAAGSCSVAGFFPSASAFQRSYGGGPNDAFVTKVSPQAPNTPATFPVQINTGAFTGRYIVHGVGQFQGSAVLNLAPGTYTFDAFGVIGGSQFNFTVSATGQLTGLTNNVAAQVCGNTLQLRAVTINVDPQGYAAEYLVNSQSFGTGFRTFTVIPGLTYIFESGGVVGGSTFNFNVGAGGVVSGISNPACATAAGNTLTLNNTSVVVNPGDYAGGYSINRLPFAYGQQSFTLIPGLRYALESGAVVGGSAFTFTLGNDGSVVQIQVPEAATASGNTINFNNVVVYVDPTTYAGAYRVQQGYTNLSGLRAVTLIPGLVAFAGTNGGGAYFTPTQVTVTPSSGVVTVNGQDHTFYFSLRPPVCAAAGPVSWWRGEGDATDSADGNDGVGLADGLSYAPGRVGSAFSFNGVDDDVQVEDANNLDVTNKFTFELWMKADSLDGFQDYLLSKVDDENLPTRDNAYSIIWEYLDNKVEFYAGGVFNQNYTGDDPRPGSAIPVNDTGWHHIAYTYDGATWSGYLDGEQVFSVQRTFSLLASPGKLHLGTFGATAHGQTYFKGMLDEVTIYNRALSAAEIRAIHDAGSAGKCEVTNRAPAADAGPDQVVEATGPTTGVSLDGSASSDPDGDALAYEWRDSSNNVVGNAAAVGLSLPLGTHTFTLKVDDGKGGTDADEVTVEVRDTTPPQISITTPAQGASYAVGQSVAADYTCTDIASNVVTCAGTVADGAATDTSSVGPKSFTVIASDAAGNTATKTVTYSVGYNVCALYDQAKAHKSGSTIPVKLRLCGPNGENLSAANVTVTALGTVRLSDFAPGEVEDAGQANPDDNFRYDAALGGYIFNLKTTGLTTGTYVLVFRAGAAPLTNGVQFQIK